jgi:hypothetical protein
MSVQHPTHFDGKAMLIHINVLEIVHARAMRPRHYRASGLLSRSSSSHVENALLPLQLQPRIFSHTVSSIGIVARTPHT